MLDIYLGIILIYICLMLFKLFSCKYAFDRILYLNIFSTFIVIFIVIYAVKSQLLYLIDLVLVYSLLGFVSLVFITRFIRRGESS